MIDLKYLKKYVRFAGPPTQIPLYIYIDILFIEFYWLLFFDINIKIYIN